MTDDAADKLKQLIRGGAKHMPATEPDVAVVPPVKNREPTRAKVEPQWVPKELEPFDRVRILRCVRRHPGFTKNRIYQHVKARHLNKELVSDCIDELVKSGAIIWTYGRSNVRRYWVPEHADMYTGRRSSSKSRSKI